MRISTYGKTKHNIRRLPKGRNQKRKDRSDHYRSHINFGGIFILYAGLKIKGRSHLLIATLSNYKPITLLV